MNYSNFLEEYLKQFNFFNEEDIELFSSITHVKKYEPGEKIMQEGKIHTKVHFLLSGLVRAYQIKESGEERTLWIGSTGAHLADPSSLVTGSTSHINIEVIEPVIVASFDTSKMEIIEKERPNILWFKCLSFQHLIKELYERIHFLNMLTPQERYAFLVENHSDYFQRIQQKHLASYIGVSEVHMSRLKKTAFKEIKR